MSGTDYSKFPKTKAPISAIILTYNEELNIKHALPISIKSFVTVPFAAPVIQHVALKELPSTCGYYLGLFFYA